MISLLLFSLVFLCVAVVAIRWRQEGFTGDALAAHQQFVEESQNKFNQLTNTLQIPDSVIPLTSTNAQQVQNSTSSAKVTISQDALYEPKQEAPYRIPAALPNNLEQARSCEAASKSCDAFNDPAFAAQCGMSFDTEGENSEGKVHQGGLYVSPNDRDVYLKRAQTVKETGSAPYDPHKVAQPTIGKAKPGTFALTKDQCRVVKEKVDCEKKQTFGSANCTQCYSSQHFSRVDPATTRLQATLFLVGNGLLTTRSTHTGVPSLVNKALSDGSPMSVALPADVEGAVIDFAVQGSTSGGAIAYLAGYFEGRTARGMFRMDLNRMIQSDKVTNTKARISGTKTINGVRCVAMIPGSGKTTMTLSCLIPFSLIDPFDSDVLGCDNGPVITKASSATFLESDPCFSAANRVGNYKLECLQDRWVSLGGSQKGTGYPSTPEKANAIQRGPGGEALDIDTIIDQVAAKIQRAVSGTNAAGQPLSLSEWNDASMWALGIPINTPCDAGNKESGPLSRDCLLYLYQNKGAANHLGATYTLLPTQNASSKGQAARDVNPNTYCQPGTAIDPATDEGLKFAQNLGGVAAVKAAYDRIHRLANDNSKSNGDRSEAVKQCYGVDLKPVTSNKVVGPTQVFAVGQGYVYSREQAKEVCATYGATVATTAQLEEAQKNGADWCFSAWVGDSSNGKWPITTTAIPGCGERRGIIEWTPDNQRAGVTCYGPKPPITDVPAGMIKPFNGEMWDQPPNATAAEPQYVRMTGGYLETSGAQPSCFNGLSAEDAQANCTAMGDKCAGFSYSVDGGGNGCYKGNVEGGKRQNPDYVGYVKIPAIPVKPDRDRSKPPPGYSQGVCNPGYYDKMKGSPAWWGCGRDCPGGMYWTDYVCNCACLPNAQDP